MAARFVDAPKRCPDATAADKTQLLSHLPIGQVDRILLRNPMLVCGALLAAALAAQPSTAATPTPAARPAAADPVVNTVDSVEGLRDEAPAPVASRRTRTIGGTVVDLIVLVEATAPADVAAAHAAAAFAELARVDALFAVDGPHIGAINVSAGNDAVSVDPEVFAVLVEVQRLARLSRGAFDPSVAAYASLWTDAERPAPAVLKARRATVGLNQLVLDPVRRTARLLTGGARIDVAAVARGYGLDRARGILIERGVKAFVLSGNGDLVVHGNKGGSGDDAGAPWMVGVQDPRATGPFMTIALDPAALGGAVMTAADTDVVVLPATAVDGPRRHRHLDPKTGEPARLVRSVTVLDADALTAACLARAIFVMGPKEGLALAARLKGPEVVIVDASNRVTTSAGLKTLAKSGALKQRQPTDGP